MITNSPEKRALVDLMMMIGERNKGAFGSHPRKYR